MPAEYQKPTMETKKPRRKSRSVQCYPVIWEAIDRFVTTRRIASGSRLVEYILLEFFQTRGLLKESDLQKQSLRDPDPKD